jgi:hypothetical protein
MLGLLIFLCLPRGQRLGQPGLEIGPPFIQRAIEEIVDYIKPAGFVWFQLIDIAVFENAGGERQSDVDNLHAFSRNLECTMARTATANCTACAALLGPPPKPVAALFTVHKSRDSWSVPAIGIVAQERPVVHARKLTMPRLQPPAGRRAWNENLN